MFDLSTSDYWWVRRKIEPLQKKKNHHRMLELQSNGNGEWAVLLGHAVCAPGNIINVTSKGRGRAMDIRKAHDESGVG